VGGFVAGPFSVVDHQRLGGAGYIFSAALPPFLASAAVAALDVLEMGSGPGLALAARRAGARLRRALAAQPPAGLTLLGEGSGAGDDASHLVVLVERGGWVCDTSDESAEGRRLRDAARAEADARLDAVAEGLLSRNIIVGRVRCPPLADARGARAGLRLFCQAGHTAADLDEAAAALREAAKEVYG